MNRNILYRNVHTGPGLGKEPESIVSYWAGPAPCTCPGVMILIDLPFLGPPRPFQLL